MMWSWGSKGKNLFLCWESRESPCVTFNAFIQAPFETRMLVFKCRLSQPTHVNIFISTIIFSAQRGVLQTNLSKSPKSLLGQNIARSSSKVALNRDSVSQNHNHNFLTPRYLKLCPKCTASFVLKSFNRFLRFSTIKNVSSSAFKNQSASSQWFS